jgi:hypothetical protein
LRVVAAADYHTSGCAHCRPGVLSVGNRFGRALSLSGDQRLGSWLAPRVESLERRANLDGLLWILNACDGDVRGVLKRSPPRREENVGAKPPNRTRSYSPVAA